MNFFLSVTGDVSFQGKVSSLPAWSSVTNVSALFRHPVTGVRRSIRHRPVYCAIGNILYV